MAITINIMIFLLSMLILIFLFTYLQWYLSKSSTRWYCYILPGISFLFACTGSFGLMLYVGDIWPIVFQFIQLNIPTLYFCFISVLCKERQKKKQDTSLEKMKIKDL